jgi:hypothetical protein
MVFVDLLDLAQDEPRSVRVPAALNRDRLTK